MDRALWLLLWLRSKAWLRRLVRNTGTVRGALLMGLGLLLFVGWWLPALLMGVALGGDRVEEVRHYGPWILVAYFLANLLFSTGENALSFNAAEVNLLFPAPLSRRQLLLFKVWGAGLSSLVGGLFFTVFLRQYAALTVAALVGVSLTVLLLQLFAMLLALVANVLGVQAYNRRRKLLLGVVVVVLAAIGFRAVGHVMAGDWRLLVDDLNQSPVAQILLSPLNWFVLAFTAEQVWPDLVQWAALAVAVNGVLLLLILALDAHYLEAAAVASERQYARLQQIRRGGPAMIGLSATGKFRLTAPTLPYLGGIGPILWRQATTFLRSGWSLVLVLLITGMMCTPLLSEVRDTRGPERMLALLIGLMTIMTMVVPTLLPFDFRGDVDRIDLLKVLPVPAWRLVVGQLLTPVAVVTLLQCLVVTLVLLLLSPEKLWWLLVGCAFFFLPLNFLLFAIENLLFLWFPSRLVATTPGDFQVLGRQVLLWLVKLFSLAVVLGLAFVVGSLVYWLAGGNWPVGSVAAWITSMVLSAAFVPLLAWAFRRFDVARDTPA